MRRLMYIAIMLVGVVSLTGCFQEVTPTPPTATPIPLEATIRTVRPDVGTLTVPYPADWVATEVQGGQVEIATNNPALNLLVSPQTVLGPGDVVGQVSLFADSEILANTNLDTIDDPSVTLLAILTAFNFAEALPEDATPQQTSNSAGQAVIWVDGQFTDDEVSRNMRFYLVSVAGGAVFAYFVAEDEAGTNAVDTITLRMMRDIIFMVGSE